MVFNWSLIKKSPRYFNFGESIIKWVSIFYSNITLVVNQRGNISDTFCLYRRCRQGDPLLTYLFLICTEIQAIKIWKSKDVKGIHFIDGEKKSLQLSLKILRDFAKISGLHKLQQNTSCLERMQKNNIVMI